MGRALIACVAAAFVAACSSQVRNGTLEAVPQTVHRSVPHPATADCPKHPGGSGVLPDGAFSEAAQPPGDEIESKGAIFAPSWIVTKGDIDFLDPAYWDMAGLCSIDIDGYYETGGFESTGFATKKGTKYTLTFALSGNGGCPPTVKQLRVQAAGSSTTFDWNTGGGRDVQNGDHTTASWTFTAEHAATEIAFISQDPKASSCGAVIAGIVVTKT